jgi:phosphoglycerate dehydrogenase-like enzyme
LIARVKEFEAIINTELPNVVLTLHNAGMTPEATITGLLMAAENVATFLTGEEINPVYRVVQGTR